jgi:hypothetical protein
VPARLVLPVLTLLFLLAAAACLWELRAGHDLRGAGFGGAALVAFLALWLVVLHDRLGPGAYPGTPGGDSGPPRPRERRPRS